MKPCAASERLLSRFAMFRRKRKSALVESCKELGKLHKNTKHYHNRYFKQKGGRIYDFSTTIMTADQTAASTAAAAAATAAAAAAAAVVFGAEEDSSDQSAEKGGDEDQHSNGGDRSSPIIHIGVICDGCRDDNFTGTRYKCKTCPDYDLCQCCIDKGIHPDHEMATIHTPIKYGGYRTRTRRTRRTRTRRAVLECISDGGYEQLLGLEEEEDEAEEEEYEYEYEEEEYEYEYEEEEEDEEEEEEEQQEEQEEEQQQQQKQQQEQEGVECIYGDTCSLLPEDKPWRKGLHDFSAKGLKELKDFVEMYEPLEEIPVQQVRILLAGQIGAGKSSFFNTINSIYRGYVTAQAATGTDTESLTTKYRSYEIRSGRRGKYMNFRLCDTMGLEDEGQGLDVTDFFLLLDGHVPDEFQFKPGQRLSSVIDITKEPALKDRIHVLAILMDATSVTFVSDTITDKLRKIRQHALKRGIPVLVVLTNIDNVCEEVKADVTKVYHSVAVFDAVKKAAEIVRMPPSQVIPIKNYETDTELDRGVDILALFALRQLMRLSDNFFDEQMNKLGISLTTPAQMNITKQDKLDAEKKRDELAAQMDIMKQEKLDAEKKRDELADQLRINEQEKEEADRNRNDVSGKLHDMELDKLNAERKIYALEAQLQQTKQEKLQAENERYVLAAELTSAHETVNTFKEEHQRKMSKPKEDTLKPESDLADVKDVTSVHANPTWNKQECSEFEEQIFESFKTASEKMGNSLLDTIKEVREKREKAMSRLCGERSNVEADLAKEREHLEAARISTEQLLGNHLKDVTKLKCERSAVELQLATEKGKREAKDDAYDKLLKHHNIEMARINRENSTVQLKLAAEKEKLKVTLEAMRQKTEELGLAQQAKKKAEEDITNYYEGELKTIKDENTEGERKRNELMQELHQQQEDSAKTITELKNRKREHEETIQKYFAELHLAQDEVRIASKEMEKYKNGEIQMELDKVTAENSRLEIAEQNRLENKRIQSEVSVISCLILDEEGQAANFLTARNEFIGQLKSQLMQQNKKLQVILIPASGDLPGTAAHLQKPHVMIMPCIAVPSIPNIERLVTKPAAKGDHLLLIVMFHPRAIHDTKVAPSAKQVSTRPPSCHKLVDVVFDRTNGTLYGGGVNDNVLQEMRDYLIERPAENKKFVQILD